MSFTAPDDRSTDRVARPRVVPIASMVLGLALATMAVPALTQQHGATAEAASKPGPAKGQRVPTGCPSPLGSGTMATPGQLALEADAARLRATPEMRAAERDVARYYETSLIGLSKDGAKTLDFAVSSVAQASAEETATLSAAEPTFLWFARAEHCWAGTRVPNAGYGIENPDNFYRHAGIDDTSDFVLAGKLGENPPSDLSVIVYGEIPGTGAVTQEGAPVLGSIALSQMQVGADGSFQITVDPRPADGRPNHIRTTSGAALLIVRDSLSDWSAEQPSTLTLERVAGTPATPPTFRERTVRAAAMTRALGRYWGVDWNMAYPYVNPANALASTPRQRPIGFATSGHFSLRSAETLVVTVDRKRAKYLGFQLADPWGVARDYVHRTGSLNGAQVAANADGTVTFVISPQDPGVQNWLDTSGLTSGLMALRWQGVPAGQTSEQAVRSVRVVPLKDLRRELPSGTRFVSAKERKAQLAERFDDYRLRMG